MQFVNLTPHLIRIARNDADVIELPSSGVARVASSDEIAGSLDGVPLVRTSYGEVTGIPEAREGIVYIVSAMVLDRTDRTDVVAPDTGATAIRKDGQVFAVRNLRTR